MLRSVQSLNKCLQHTGGKRVPRWGCGFTINAGFPKLRSTLTSLPRVSQQYATMAVRQSYQSSLFYKNPVLRKHVRDFSSKGANDEKTKSSTLSNSFWYLAKILKIIRIPILVVAVYSLGYQQGIVEYSRNPDEKRKELLNQIVSGVGCDDPNRVFGVQEGRELKRLLADVAPKYACLKYAGKTGYEEGADREIQLRHVASIGHRIVESAKLYVDEKLSEAEGQEQKEEWTEAKKRIGDGNTIWSFILIDVPTPNAFVSETMPQMIFVTTALLETFVSNDDELALVLGHEVSHLILGHLSERNSYTLGLSIFELVLLSLDPTEGLVSMFVVGAIGGIKSLLDASFSRETELEADELGVKIAARACYNTKVAPLVFKKMHENHLEELHGDANKLETDGQVLTLESNIAKDDGTENSNEERDQENKEIDRRSGGWLDTHPPELKRYHNLMLASQEENPEKYLDSHCAQLKKSFLDSLMLRSQIFERVGYNNKK